MSFDLIRAIRINMKKTFNPKNWLQTNQNGLETQVPNLQISNKSGVHNVKPTKVIEEIELLVSRIEAMQTDLTSSYPNWCKIGFALAHELGEGGREYFHRISRFYPRYSRKDCDLQYDRCLAPTEKRTSISSLFYMAREAGIDIGKKEIGNFLPGDEPLEEEKLPLIFDTPQLPSEVYHQLPQILQESCTLFQDGIEKDVFLIASLAVLSGCLPNIRGSYFDEKYSAHLYTFITAPAGSGKGKMKWAKYFGQLIHDRLVEHSYKERAEYDKELQVYENMSKAQRQNAERPIKPPRRMFYIPANSSSSAFTQALAENNYSGIIFETEADTMAGSFKQDWGNFSDVLRKAFHHESTSLFRRKDNEYIEIKDPHLAMALSGTVKQVHNLMPDVENGLFSRFMYYAFEDNSEFKNPFISFRKVDYAGFLQEKAGQICRLYEQLNERTHPISFTLTEEQGRWFTTLFGTMLAKNKLLIGGALDANIKRLGLITFRIAMILTALRLLEGSDNENVTTITENSHLINNLKKLNNLVCSDRDYETAMTIAATLEKHAIAVFQRMPNNELKGNKLAFYDKLPGKFDRQGYVKLARELGIPIKTADRYIGQFKPRLLHHEFNDYTKI